MLTHSYRLQRECSKLLWFLILLAPLVARSAPLPTLPPPAMDEPKAAGAAQTAVLAGGCFWGVQGVFEHVRGVRRVVAGYSGGDQAHAHYDQVSMGNTGHAESVQITFDPQQLSYGEVLRIFFSVVHDPTELNRQGPDVGTQYRSSIFYGSEAQRRIALAYIEQLEKSKIFVHPIVTRVDPLRGFFAAEGAHQDFLLKYPDNPYIVYNDLPKIVNLQRLLPEYYQGRPITVAGSDP
jgi:peptide-methionine (S)-S-oxide reductase